MQILKIHREITREAAEADGGPGSPWEILFNLVERLGKNGQSSDESDGEMHIVRVKDWWSAEVQRLLEFIDSNRSTVTILGTQRPGTRPHCHTQSQLAPRSMCGAVPGLPKNFYNQTWYQSLRSEQRKKLKALSAIELPVVD